MKAFTFILFSLFGIIGSLSAQVENSVLSSGQWYKLAIVESGIYRIDKNLLDKTGLNIGEADARNIAVYGNAHNGMLPQLNSASRPDDLTENAIFQSGLSDGSFDSNDFILFYGASAHHLSFDRDNDQFRFETNLYSDTAYYFVTIKDSAALKISTGSNQSTGASYSTSYLRYLTHEAETFNHLKSGRNWWGDLVTQSRPLVDVSFISPELVSGSDIEVDVRLVSTSKVPANFEIKLNDQFLGTVNMSPVPDIEYEDEADFKTANFTISTDQLTNQDEGLTASFEYNTGEFSSGYVDYVHLKTEQSLNLVNDPIILFRRSISEAFEIQNATNAFVWDITTPTRPVLQNTSFTNSRLRFQSDPDSEKFIIFNYEHAIEPRMVGSVSNQNLHALQAAQVIYITHKQFLAPTQRLANFRLAKSGLLTEVVTVEQIYNEFSSGAQDISAIRDFIKFQYEKHGQILRYVTLMGDCSFDYKKRTIRDTNFVPVYETRNSHHRIQSFSSDDYYGFLEPDEGEWAENSTGNHTMEIGIGRIPVQTADAAEKYVNKVIRYETSTFGFGNWRNKIAFVADDGDGNSHQLHADSLAKIVVSRENSFNAKRIFLDAFKQVNQKSPDASNEFIDALTKGNLIVNFIGHGNTSRLTHEDIFLNDMINGMKNRQLMPFFVTATCDFGKYDDPSWVSGGEQILLHPQGGAIAMLSSARSVYSSSNFEINRAFYEALGTRENGQLQRLGDIVRITKNNSFDGTRNRNYALLGDASMRLAFPDQRIVLDSINESPIQALDTLGALGRYRIKGHICAADSTIDEDFDGTVLVSLFDKPTQFQTYGDESSPGIYSDQNVLLFQGLATVSEGQFTSEFILPVNIDYSFGAGKISFYALDSTRSVDAHGANDNLIIGGSVQQDENDRIPPEIEIYLDNQNFKDGGIVGENSLLLVWLSDESGINTSKLGIGNDLVMFLDDGERVVLNDYYQASLDTYQEGWISYPMDNLTAGKHAIEIIAYDTYNNRADRSVTFRVRQEPKLNLSQVSGSPNPVQAEQDVTFRFSHDRAGEDLRVDLKVLNMEGQVIMHSDYRFVDASTHIDTLIWNGRDVQGNRLRKGLYIYKLTVQSELDGAKSEKYGKLIVLN